MRKGKVLGKGERGEEVEVLKRPKTTPEVQGRQEGKKSNKVSGGCLPTLVFHVSHRFVDRDNEDNEHVRKDDAVPGHDILHSDLTGVEDVPVLKLPHGPPCAYHQSMNYGVGEDSIPHNSQEPCSLQ